MSKEAEHLDSQRRVTPTLSEQIAAIEDSRPMKTLERRATDAVFDSPLETSGQTAATTVEEPDLQDRNEASTP